MNPLDVEHPSRLTPSMELPDKNQAEVGALQSQPTLLVAELKGDGDADESTQESSGCPRSENVQLVIWPFVRGCSSALHC